MKRVLIFALCVAVLIGSVSSQTMSELADALKVFSDAASPALLTNSVIGTGWSEAWIGDLIALPPHFGVGITAGASTIPVDGIKPLLDATGAQVPEVLNSIGVPLPAMVINARVGGIILPFDVGAKVGFIPPQALTMIKDSVPGLDINYLLIGADVRYALVKQDLLLPNISVGLGYNNLTMNMKMPIDIAVPSFSFNDGAPHTLAIAQPNMSMDLSASTFDLTAQISKNLLIITPYLGAGCTFGIGTTKTGLASELTYDGTPVSEATLASLKAALSQAGIDMPDLSTEGLFYAGQASGPIFRVFGGLSLNILIIRLDIGAFYNITGKNLGVQVGTRVQF